MAPCHAVPCRSIEWHGGVEVGVLEEHSARVPGGMIGLALGVLLRTIPMGVNPVGGGVGK